MTKPSKFGNPIFSGGNTQKFFMNFLAIFLYSNKLYKYVYKKNYCSIFEAFVNKIEKGRRKVINT